MKNEIFNVIQGNSGVSDLSEAATLKVPWTVNHRNPGKLFKGNGGEERDKLPVFSKTSSLLSLFRWIVLH